VPVSGGIAKTMNSSKHESEGSRVEKKQVTTGQRIAVVNPAHRADQLAQDDSLDDEEDREGTETEASSESKHFESFSCVTFLFFHFE
jgi:hypothetical protein